MRELQCLLIWLCCHFDRWPRGLLLSHCPVFWAIWLRVPPILDLHSRLNHIFLHEWLNVVLLIIKILLFQLAATHDGIWVIHRKLVLLMAFIEYIVIFLFDSYPFLRHYWLVNFTIFHFLLLKYVRSVCFLFFLFNLLFFLFFFFIQDKLDLFLEILMLFLDPFPPEVPVKIYILIKDLIHLPRVAFFGVQRRDSLFLLLCSFTVRI